MGGKLDIQQGTLALMVLKTLEAMGPLHGYGIARRIETDTGDALSVEEGSLYPALYRLEERGYVTARWGAVSSGRRVRLYRLTKAGHARLAEQREQWISFSRAVARMIGRS